MQITRSAKRSIIFPLIGLTLLWISFMAAIYSDLFNEYPSYDSMGNYLGPDPRVQISTYLFLAGVALFAVFALIGQRRAIALRAQQELPITRAAHRFGNLAVIIGLVAGTYFAIGKFLSSLGSFDDREASTLVRIFDTYVPIILATILVVTVILMAFVFRKALPNAKRFQFGAAAKPQDLQQIPGAQRAIALAYSMPIIATAIAVIFGLIVRDVTRTNLDVWIWVIIQVLIGSGILGGTYFAAKARGFTVAAVNLNLVLAIIFGVVVTIMAFAFGASAIDSLRVWPEWTEKMYEDAEQYVATINGPSGIWFLNDMLPALVLLALAEFGIYRTTVVRNTVEPAAESAETPTGGDA